MKQLIEYFDRVYIINLADRLDRRRAVKREFQRIGINIPNEKVSFFTATRPSEKGSFADIGLRGCFTSHRDILESANRGGLNNVLILEDDVSFRSVADSFDQLIIDRLIRIEWDIVYFGYLAPLDDELTGPLMAWPANVTGAHFYAVNGQFIEKLLRYMNACETRPSGHPDGGPMSPDAVFSHMRTLSPEMRLFLAVPNLALQRSSRTDVHPKLVLDRVVWLAPLMRSGRLVKHECRMWLDKVRLWRKMNKRRS